MKRIHIHLHVSDLAASVDFYQKLFGGEPDRREHDYARWSLSDPPVNLALSTAGQPGLGHLGIEAGEAHELEPLRRAAERAGAVTPETDAACCYARSDKAWVSDPDGIAWEQFHSHGESDHLENRAGACGPTHAVAGGCCG